MRKIVKTPKEINEMLGRAVDMVCDLADQNKQTNFSAMSYEEGVMYALTWLFYPADEDEGGDILA